MPQHQTLNPRQWQAHVQAFLRSGLSRAEYCRQHNLSYHALTYWQRKISARQPDPSKECTLVPVSLQPWLTSNGAGEARSALRVILPGGCAIEVGDGFSSTTLSRLLAALEGR